MVVDFISPSRLLQNAIADAISSVFEIAISPYKIPITIGYPKYDAHYTSTIALAISHSVNRYPLQIAEAIAQTCSQNLAISSKLQIQAFGKGWLNIYLSQEYITESLLALNEWQIEGIAERDGFWQKCDFSPNSNKSSPELILQYAYARCCALMRLAYNSDSQPSVGNHSSVLEPAEVSLLLQNFAIAAYLESENSLDSHPSRMKLSRSLAETFLHFYDHCRIFGVDREIALRRLSIIRVTQKMLFAIAPPEINYEMYL